MFKKNDPLVDSVKAVMEQNAKERQIEAAVNEEFGVHSKNALPHEYRVAYEQRLNEMKKCMYEGEWEKAKSPTWTKATPPHAPNTTPSGGMEEGAEGTVPKTKRDKNLAALAEPKHLITHKDVLTGRGAIEEKWHEESSKKKDIEEKVISPYAVGMAAAMKSTGDEPPLEKSTIVKAHKIAKKVAKKEGKEIEEQAVFEEIRNNLEEQLVSVYESGDSEAFADFVSSLSEEQIEILGLNEVVAPSAGGGYGPDSPRPRPLAPPAEKPAPFAGSTAAAAGAKSTMDFKTPSTPSTTSPSATAADRASSTAHMGLSSATPQAAPAATSSVMTQDRAPSNITTKFKPPTPESARGLPEKPTKPVDYGGASAKPGATPAGQKIAGQVAAVRAKDNVPSSGTIAPTSTSSVSRPSAPRPGMRPGMPSGPSSKMQALRQKYTPSVVGGDIASNVQARLREETKPQIKESFEHFLRNKFLKG